MAHRQNSSLSSAGPRWAAFALALGSLFLPIGCGWRSQTVDQTPTTTGIALPSRMLTQEDPAVACPVPEPEMTAPPATLRDFESLQPHDLTLEEAIRATLQNSKILQKLGGQVVTAPAATTTIFDPAFTASSPQLGSEAALSAFDAQFATSMYYDHSERRFNNPFFGGGVNSLNSNTGTFRTELSKTTAVGTTFALRNSTDYSKNNSPVNLFPGVWDTVTVAEVRQPLLAGAGVDVNRIAGPGRVIGNYNGVLIARIREDISIADFEAAIRNLVRDVEQTYWTLYFNYQDLDTKLDAQERARRVWQVRQTQELAGAIRKDDEAQARQQYFNFRSQAQNAIVGTNAGGGLYATERQLRRLMDLPVSDGTLLRPVTPPCIAPIAFDWNHSQNLAMQNRVELKRQRWTLRQSELELIAAKNLSQWRVDLVGNYGWRGFGDNLIGNQGAIKDQLAGDLDDWRMGVEVGGPIGRRAGYVAVRNAEIKLARDRARLEEQQKQVLYDLANAYSEVDRAYAQIRAAINNRIAVDEELHVRNLRYKTGNDNVFFLLDAQQRAATSESNVHRAIADYNIALMNYTFQAGTLLANYNINLDEAPSQARLYEAAAVKASFFQPGGGFPVHQRVSNGSDYGASQDIGFPGKPGDYGLPTHPAEPQDEGTSRDSDPRATDERLDELDRKLQNLAK